MGRPVHELLQSMDAAELVTWLAYSEIDPWVDERADWRMGMICSVIANCTTGAKTKPADFTPEFRPAEPQITGEVDDDKLLLEGMKWCAALGGKLK